MGSLASPEPAQAPRHGTPRFRRTVPDWVAQELNPNLPPGLSDLVMKSMAVDKTKRFQSMDELRIALEKFGHLLKM